MNITVVVVGLFGLFSLVGGLIGYFKADSMASLLAGLISGLLLMLGAFGISKDKQIFAYITLLVAILLGGRFFMTLIKSFKFMPDLLMVVFSLVTIVLVGLYIFKK
jgi:uncharacterized membrane protein (UPF0136 family)